MCACVLCGLNFCFNFILFEELVGGLCLPWIRSDLTQTFRQQTCLIERWNRIMTLWSDPREIRAKQVERSPWTAIKAIYVFVCNRNSDFCSVWKHEQLAMRILAGRLPSFVSISAVGRIWSLADKVPRLLCSLFYSHCGNHFFKIL